MSVIRANAQKLVSSTFFTATDVIERLHSIGWIRIISTQAITGGTPPPVLYFLDMEATEKETLDPLELLQGYRPDGVLCYFGVLAHHGLTTQVPPFFHVAFLEKSPRPRLRTGTAMPIEESTIVKPKRDPLGQRVFEFEGVSCYLTKRNPSFVPGIQTRIVGSRTILRMTTIEQTMIDTLGYPLHCGGEGVVFEAWERGTGLWNEDRFAEYLQKIDQPEMDRRVGAILETLELKADSRKLQARLEAVRASSANNVEVSLLRGFFYPNLNRTWNVRVP
jgi:predicted transcriptional regulator of viral defense system